MSTDCATCQKPDGMNLDELLPGQAKVSDHYGLPDLPGVCSPCICDLCNTAPQPGASSLACHDKETGLWHARNPPSPPCVLQAVLSCIH
mmetsp:Transcript_612/g.1217  ORF Transcript_612/g.1217 Transcript_612/m.1217 type:complete len:89 (+) Transcript_612:108-374(+)